MDDARRPKAVPPAWERYELLSRYTNDIVLFIAEGGAIVEANDAAVRLYGYSHEELLGKHVADLRAPHTIGDFALQLRRAFDTGVLFETEHIKKDGTVVPVEVGSRSATIGGERLLLSIIRDITERREIQARLVQADRMGAFGMIAAGVAHEINNPLAYALNNLEMLGRQLPTLTARVQGQGMSDIEEALGQMAQMLSTANEGILRVRDIMRDLRAFSRADQEPHEGVDIREVVESAINLAHGDLRHRARLVRDYGEVAMVRANPSRLGQVFLNLLLNAAQAIPPSRATEHQIHVAIRQEGDALIVEVSDDGVGIPKVLVARIFEPFVTTKPEGTGLGLYIARTTVRDLGGEVEVVPRPSGGTTMRVRLPTTPLSPLPARIPSSAPAPDARWRILVVDDEVTLGLTLRDVLAGVRDVAVVTSGEDALLQIASSPKGAPFDAVLCDLMMPGMSGAELHACVVERYPAIASRFVFMTGGATTIAAQDFIRTTSARCLTKPFSVAELESALHGVSSGRFNG